MKKILLLALLPVTAMAASIKGIGEIYQDWDLICDNTGTCRMAGYQENRDDPVSILFTREAGPNTPVEGELTILPFGENDRDIQVGQDVEIWLNDKSLGTIKHISDSNPDKLTEEQTKAILSGLTKESEIRLTYGKTTLRVSDRGAAAVMLRMDEFQQRLNTPSALIRRGQEKQIDEVLIQGKFFETPYQKVNENIVVIQHKEIEQSPAKSIDELLQQYTGVDIRKRGGNGVLSDISIRGGSYDQVLILVNGIRMNDSQTGHNSFNIPIDLSNVEQIEIVKGPAARRFGNNAYAGVINIITKTHKEKTVNLF